MPECPELKHSRDRLREVLLDKKITRLTCAETGRYKTKQPVGMSEIIQDLPLKVTSINTKGKFMWWTLEGKTKNWYMWCTYGMSGQWSRSAGKHVGFIVEFNDSGTFNTREQQKMFFNDTRRFGTIKFVYNQDQHDKKLNSLGPDVLEDPPVDPEIFAKRILHKPNRTIAEALMDQSGVAGVGNYLRAEILYDCGVDPWRNVTEITSEEYVKLCEATVRIAEASYKSQGASIKTYRNVDGSTGTAQFDFKAYGCKECPLGHEIMRRHDENGRMVHWCTLCQK